jgi:hypothetical protein
MRPLDNWTGQGRETRVETFASCPHPTTDSHGTLGNLPFHSRPHGLICKPRGQILSETIKHWTPRTHRGVLKLGGIL